MDALDSLRPGSALFNIGLTFLFRHDLDELVSIFAIDEQSRS